MGERVALLRAEIQQVSFAEARQCWQASTKRVYKSGDKMGKPLYWLATQAISAWVVPLIRDWTGDTQEDLEEIACTFVSCYEDLYSRVPQLPAERENPILKDISLPSIPASLATELDLPLTEDRVNCAISALQAGKTPGPDSYPIEYFQRFCQCTSGLPQGL
ncbi:hypothetical protein NDU88_000726 [Pleurodeles waltl]|uniref:Uncharacterized protein n=1 Tax=Pleurodeles waltl TaxID=8319 RepID=A0AAV7NBB2_PLEWA|nr:hypothetical protein NDU88_000726 [Pleurodeles waltl]